MMIRSARACPQEGAAASVPLRHYQPYFRETRRASESPRSLDPILCLNAQIPQLSLAHGPSAWLELAQTELSRQDGTRAQTRDRPNLGELHKWSSRGTLLPDKALHRVAP